MIRSNERILHVSDFFPPFSLASSCVLKEYHFLYLPHFHPTQYSVLGQMPPELV